MRQYTKESIVGKTLELAERKPLTKITVREICEACEITRNAFYYYFHDIFDVMEYFIDDSVEQLLRKPRTDAESVFFDMIELFSTHRTVWLNLYKSVGHEELERIIAGKLEALVRVLLENTKGGSELSELDMQIISIFYRKTFFGILIEWLNGTKEENKEQMRVVIERIRVIFDGQIELMVKNSLAN